MHVRVYVGVCAHVYMYAYVVGMDVCTQMAYFH